MEYPPANIEPIKSPLARRRKALAAAAILLATLIAYLPALRGGYIWDDDAYLTENPHLTSINGLGRIWFDIGATDQYYPLVFTTFWIERHFWGLSPLGFHLVNVLLHATGAILVWFVLRRLDVRGAGLAASLFALHPVHVESVAWITERKNVLSGVFYLSAIWAYLRFADCRVRADGSDRPQLQWRWYLLAMLFFACALLSKTVTVTLPVVVLLLIWWKRGGLRRSDILAVVPMVGIGAAAGRVTVWMERHHVGTEYVDWHLAFSDRLLIAGRAVWFYLGKLVWPVPLTFIYPQWKIPGAPAWQFVAPLGVVAVLAILWMFRNRIGRGAFVAIFFFVVTLAPALGFVDVYPMRFSFVTDHFQYLASIGPIALMVAVAAKLSKTRPVARIGGGAVLLVLAAMTWEQCGIYKDSETLWRDTLRKNPTAWMAYGNLAAELARQGRIGEAMEHYREGLRLKEDAPQVHFNLANLQQGQGALDEAIAHYERAIQLLPRYADAHNNFAVCLAAKGRTEEAASHYEAALAIKPDYADAHGNLANLRLAQGRVDEAIAHGQRAIELAPDHPFFHFNLATALLKQGRKTEAAVQLNAAEQSFEALLRANPDHAQARAGLARTRAALTGISNP